jgi:AbiV family abortive infection protein
MSKTSRDATDKQLLISELTRGAEKVFENAEALFKEACLLRAIGALSRSLFLHQISLEECAKLEILGAWATSLLMGYEVNLTKIKKAMASHANKNRTNAYFLKVTADEEAAKQRRDFKGAAEAFSEMQKSFHLKANTAKNASLYVDFADGKFVAPNECITPEMVNETASRNEEFLALSFPKLEMLRKWATNPEPICEELVGFEKRIKELGDQYLDDPEKALKTLLQEMLERRLEMEKTRQNKNASQDTATKC